MSLVIYLFIFPIVQPILGYATEIGNEMQWLVGIRNIFIIFTCAFIFVSVPFAFYLRLHKFILFGVIGTISDIIDKIFPFFFLSGMYGQYIVSIGSLFLPIILFSTIIFLSILLMITTKYKEEVRIRKEILELGTKYTDFKLKNISKNCRSDRNTIIAVAKKMIKNKEIYADYFKLSKKFVFNNKANTEEIDNLMEMFSEWETEHMEKKA